MKLLRGVIILKWDNNGSRISRITRIFVLGIVVLVGLLFFVRLILPSQVDDVSPGMNCSDEILDLGDVYFVVPKFGGVEIDEEWCDYILGKDKEIAMHGVVHSFEEFGVVRDEEYFGEGVEIFRECFGVVPDRFKPGQLVLSEENDWIRGRMEVDLFWNQVFHKVYHCGDSGVFSNWFIRVF